MSVAEELAAACPALRPQEPLSKHTSLAIGGPADYYADVNTFQELTALRKIVAKHKTPVFFLGAGSNLLVSDRGIRGLVLHLQGDFRTIEFEGTRVNVGAGAMMPAVAKQSAEQGLTGVEALIGVPGTIGGGLVMNAGTREGWLGNVVTSVRVLGDALKVETLTSEAFGFSYRHSNLEGRWIVGAELALKTDEPASIMKRIDDLLQHRTRTQPLTTSNCGSVFKNPSEGPAAQWIEKAGFKGTAIGGARVSERHANFIINDKNAMARDVRELMDRIQKKVLEQFKVRLEPEVKLVGEW
jgi:UDP-N-acetylmuramate dehydrogenase